MTTTLDALTNPTPTRAKREARFDARLATVGTVDTGGNAEIPGVDVAKLQAEYRDYGVRPVKIRGDVLIPIKERSESPERFEARLEWSKREGIKRYLTAMEKQGWRSYVDAAHPPEEYPGVYPAWDLET